MCGRYALAIQGEILQKRYHLKEVKNFLPRYNIAPTQQVPVIIKQVDEYNTMLMMRWGLIPSWSKGIDNKKVMINIRLESCLEKPGFKGLWQKHRCIVPISGFFEWKEQVPYYIFSAKYPLLSLAAIWDTWHSLEGEVIHSVSTITTQAIPPIEQLHNRMPLIIPVDKEQEWLSNERTLQSTQISFLLEQMHSYDWQYYPVNPKVNYPKNDTPDVLEPFSPPSFQASLF
ncbi:MAG: SOS response-associated peptidase [Bacteroidia bacterium]|nr:SOS response-associated peptidase [Bacteroidia bacterium]MDW8159226.1 SOS response-associated peptidase [Bacteroidia bacterium]